MRVDDAYIDGVRQRAACLVFSRDAGGALQLLLVGATHPPRHGDAVWVLPGGGVHVGEAGSAAAARETMEEAGASGVVAPAGDEPLVWVEHSGGGGGGKERSRTGAYVMACAQGPLADEYEDAGRRARAWVPLSSARALLKPKAAAVFDAAMAAGAEAAFEAAVRTGVR